MATHKTDLNRRKPALSLTRTQNVGEAPEVSLKEKREAVRENEWESHTGLALLSASALALNVDRLTKKIPQGSNTEPTLCDFELLKKWLKSGWEVIRVDHPVTN